MEWYYSNNGQEAGPVSQDQLAELFRNGTVKPFDPVWTESMTEWVPIGKVEAFAFSAPATVGPGSFSPQFGVPPKKTNGLAIASLVLGILSMLICGVGMITGIPAVICGHLSLSRIANDPTLKGKGLALAGLIMGYLGIVATIAVFMLGGMAIILESMK